MFSVTVLKKFTGHSIFRSLLYTASLLHDQIDPNIPNSISLFTSHAFFSLLVTQLVVLSHTNIGVGFVCLFVRYCLVSVDVLPHHTIALFTRCV